MAEQRAPEETIRRWLDQNGTVTVGMKALAQTWRIEKLSARDRRRIATALESAGVLCEPPLRRATARDKLTLSLASAPAPGAAPAPEPMYEPEPDPEPEPEPLPERAHKPLPEPAWRKPDHRTPAPEPARPRLDHSTPAPEPARRTLDHTTPAPEERPEARAPAAAVALPAPDRRLLGLATAAVALMVIGAFGPWAKAIFTTDTGFDRDGLLVIVCAAAAALVLLVYARRDQPWALPLVSALLGAVSCGIIASNYRDIRDDSFIHAGWGLYLSFSGSAALAVLGIALLARREAPEGERSGAGETPGPSELITDQ
jgi:hypothetical protein